MKTKAIPNLKKFVLFYLCALWSLIAFAQHDEKINGVSYVSSRDPIDFEHIKPVLDIHANWTALSPFGFMPGLNAPDIRYNMSRQWRGERTDGIREMARLFKKNKVKILLKPQLWISHGDFTGHIKMNTEEDWLAFEKNYADFILTFAKLAEEEGIEMFSIGTELATYVAERPDAWKALIEAVRKVYSGKLTYAENWDAYHKFPHWKSLDFIGIDAYFPLSEAKTPEVAELLQNWKPVKEKIRTLSVQTGKDVVFTEYGYRSLDYTAKRPWDSSRELKDINFKAQENALTAIYRTFWNEPWFEGGFLWKWFHRHDESGGENDSQYTVQNKPAEGIIRQLYRR
ncbi:MAG: glycoside hydrolase [Flavobacteriaceae bacterium]|nr:glycoside hydrolase [Flavobacteriaceae bacterium]